MSVTTTWTGGLFVAEWTIVDPAGAPVTDATVTGAVALPDGTDAAMVVTSEAGSNVYTATYQPTTAGRHAWALAATGTAAGAEQGEFVVRRDLVGLPPITVDPTSSIGQVRLLATDVDEVSPLFEDQQISAFLAMEANNVKLAAATALETIARSETLISKKITTSEGISTDGPAVAKELRESARALRAQVAEDTQVTDSAAVLPVYSFPAPVSWGDSNFL